MDKLKIKEEEEKNVMVADYGLCKQEAESFYLSSSKFYFLSLFVYITASIYSGFEHEIYAHVYI